MFITFEGGEGGGKTTVMKKLEKYLIDEGHRVVTTREPGGTPLGEHVRDCLLNPEFGISFGDRAELMLFLASRVQHIEELIKPALSQGQVVLCDRFNDSSIAYQGGGRSLGVEEVEEICDRVCGGFKPNLTFFLDLDPQTGMDRLEREKDRLESEKMVFHENVREAYRYLADKHSDRIHVIDASQSPEDVFGDVLTVVQSVYA